MARKTRIEDETVRYKTKSEYDMAYMKENQKRVELKMKKDVYDVLKEHADRAGLPVNTYIKEAIAEKIERDDRRGNE